MNRTRQQMEMKLPTLVLCDDAWHPAAVIQRGLAALADARFNFEFVTHGAQWSATMMNEFPLVVVVKANHLCAMDQTPWLTLKTQSAFREFVQRGGGLLLLHAGTCYKDLPEMRGVTGGTFLSHPEQSPVTIEPKAGHPITDGVEKFTMQDEHYVMTLDDAAADVFLHSRSEHGVQPSGWTRSEGFGRVCVLTPGHNIEVWLHPSFQKLLLNTLRWVAKLN